MTETPTSFHSLSLKTYLGQDPKNTIDCTASLDQNANNCVVTVPVNASKQQRTWTCPCIFGCKGVAASSQCADADGVERAHVPRAPHAELQRVEALLDREEPVSRRADAAVAPAGRQCGGGPGQILPAILGCFVRPKSE